MRGTLFIVYGMTVALVGKIDGQFEDSGEVIEAKERRNRLFKQVVDYEKAQLHCYMHLTDTKVSTLRERYDDEIMEHTVEFEAGFWEEMLHKLRDFVVERVRPYADERALTCDAQT